MISVFSKEWFKKYNRIITKVARLPILGEWIFNFKKFGHYIDRKRIVEVTPNSVIEFVKMRGKKKVELRQHFFVRNEYALRLQKVFYPIWIAFHIWDVITRPFPHLNLGFDTLTVNPDVSSGSTTCDGLVGYTPSSTTWASVIGATDGSFVNTTAAELAVFSTVSSTTTNEWVRLYRPFFSVDTSSIPDAATISATVFSVYGIGKLDNLSITPNLNVYLATPASANNLVVGDYDQVGSVAQCDTAITYAGYSTSGYNDFTFNATGRGNVSKTGITKLCIRNASYDVAASAPTWSSDKSTFMNCYHSDNGSNKPKLVVTYTTSTAYTTEITEALAMVSSDLQTQGLLTAITNTLALSETQTNALKFNQAISEILALSETLTNPRILVATLTENLSLSETETNLLKFSQEINESLGLSEDNVAGLLLTASILEALGLSEEAAGNTNITEDISDVLSLAQELWGDWWEELSKHSTSWTQSSKNTTSYTQQSKNTTSWTQETKNKTNTKLG
jgi:hypothetical protein